MVFIKYPLKKIYNNKNIDSKLITKYQEAHKRNRGCALKVMVVITISDYISSNAELLRNRKTNRQLWILTNQLLAIFQNILFPLAVFVFIYI